MEKVIANQNFDEERALYHLKDTVVEHCRFSGPADGESVLKEARNQSQELQFFIKISPVAR